MNIKKLPTWAYALYTGIIVLGVLLDQLTKWLAVVYLKVTDTVPLIEGVLHLTYVENRGAAFGMLADNRWVFLVVSSVMILVLTPYLYLGLCEGKLASVSVAMIISGGIGNMIDRLALGYVVDFIDVRLINFAVFNGADSFVCVGAALLVVAMLRELKKEIRAEREKKRTPPSNEPPTP